MLENVFEFPYRVLTLLGLWAIESNNGWLRFMYFVYQSLAFFYLITFSSFLFFDLYSAREDVHKATTNLSASMTVLMLLWKNTQGLLKFQQLRHIQKGLSRGLHSKEDDTDTRTRQILRKATTEIKLACVVVYLLGLSTVLGLLASGLVLTDRNEVDNLPLPLFIPWSHQKSPYYEFALLSEVYGGCLVTFDVLSLNLSIFGTIVQICAEFDILHKNTELINEWYRRLPGTRGGVRILNEKENVEVKGMIVRNIRHHQKIIDYTNESENCYTHMMLVQFGGSTILITVVFLDLILVTGELNSRVYPLIIFLLLVISDAYLFCNYGSRLINKSHEFQSSVYGIPWEAMNSQNRRMISLMILKAQRPPKLTIEKFANVDLYSLLGLGKIVYNILYLLLHVARDR